MKNLFRLVMLTFIIGTVFGWRLNEEKQRRARKAAEQAFLNDPEVIAHRRQRETMYRIDGFMDRLEYGDEE